VLNYWQGIAPADWVCSYMSFCLNHVVIALKQGSKLAALAGNVAIGKTAAML
jgi:hypothetical protein